MSANEARVVDASSVEPAIAAIERTLTAGYPVSRRFVAGMLVAGDEDARRMVADGDGVEILGRTDAIIQGLRERLGGPPAYHLAMHYRRRAAAIHRAACHTSGSASVFRDGLDRVLMHPVAGVAALLVILYWGLYKFVGQFGAGTVVDLLEDGLFGTYVNPWAVRFFEAALPWPVARDLFVGEYGIVTLGLRYAVSLILPIVTFFFLFFSVIEDTGYLPRLAMLCDRLLKRIGLSGRAVIPLVLGFGCATMATLVTRTLPTRRERLVATVLLSLTVPCSAQLGVILALLSSNPVAMGVWASFVAMTFLGVGFAMARLVPGEKPSFYMELPPLRVPAPANVLMKTFVRVKWYFIEILPLFLLASVLIWAGRLTGVFEMATGALRGPVLSAGLPAETAPAFLFGFFRRDYGAAGLYDLYRHGALGARQLVVACTALTLFLPCVAQFLMTVRERGLKTGIAVSAFILVFAYVGAVAMNAFLVSTGILR